MLKCEATLQESFNFIINSSTLRFEDETRLGSCLVFFCPAPTRLLVTARDDKTCCRFTFVLFNYFALLSNEFVD